jgi:hypothetical protein
VDAEVSKTSGAFARQCLLAKTGGADGEVVWSRYPDADIKPLKPLRGECRVFRRNRGD